MYDCTMIKKIVCFVSKTVWNSLLEFYPFLCAQKQLRIPVKGPIYNEQKTNKQNNKNKEKNKKQKTKKK